MLDFRLYEPSDRDGCLDLLREGHDPDFSLERFRWLHESGPSGPSSIALCLDEGRIVGMYSVLPKAFHLAGREYRAGRDVDPVVHPSCRGQGVFRRLLEFGLARFGGFDFLFNFANAASAPGFLRQGWRRVMPLEDRVVQLGCRSLLSREGLLWGLGRVLRPPARGLRTRALDDGALRTLLTGDPRFAGQGQPPPQGGVRRDRGYLAWRYLEHPLHDYRYFLAEDLDGRAAVAVCRHHPEADRLDLVDLAAFGILPPLAFWLPLWTEQFPRSAVVAWNTLPRPVLAGFLGNPGRRGKGAPLLVREFPGHPFPAGLDDGGSWYLTRGDLEIA